MKQAQGVWLAHGTVVSMPGVPSGGENSTEKGVNFIKCDWGAFPLRHVITVVIETRNCPPYLVYPFGEPWVPLHLRRWVAVSQTTQHLPIRL